MGHGTRYLLLLALGVGLSGCAHFQARPLSPKRQLTAFEARSLADPGLRTFLAANGSPEPAPGQPWGLESLTLAAFYLQPTLAEQREALLAVEAGVRTAAERPNPTLSVAVGNDAGVPGAFSPWSIPLGLDWPIETAGRRSYRIAEVRDRALAARWQLIGGLWQVRARLRSALLALYAARQTEAVLAREATARERVLELLQGQFTAGAVSSFEVTQARIARDGLVLAQQQAAGQELEARVAVAGALGLTVDQISGIPLSFSAFQQFPQQLTGPGVRRQALLGRADLRAALADYAATQAALQLQIALQYPQIHLGPGYTWNAQLAGDSQWVLGVSLTLPLLNHNQGPIAEAQAARALAAAHFDSIQSAAITQIDSALAAYRAPLERLGTVQGLSIDLRRRLASVQAQVQAGELQPLDLANAQVAFEVGTQQQLQAQLDAQSALGQLEQAMQSSLTLPARAIAAAQNTPAPSP
ncbi:MAG: TolC family protein [Steroidobacteraceae bacterium]